VSREGPHGGTPEDHACCKALLRTAEQALQGSLQPGGNRAADKAVRSVLHFLDDCEPLRHVRGPQSPSLAVRLLAEFQRRCASLQRVGPSVPPPTVRGDRPSALGRLGPQPSTGHGQGTSPDAPWLDAAASGLERPPRLSSIHSRLSRPSQQEGNKRRTSDKYSADSTRVAATATVRTSERGSPKRPRSGKLQFVGLFELVCFTWQPMPPHPPARPRHHHHDTNAPLGLLPWGGVPSSPVHVDTSAYAACGHTDPPICLFSACFSSLHYRFVSTPSPFRAAVPALVLACFLPRHSMLTSLPPSPPPPWLLLPMRFPS